MSERLKAELDQRLPLLPPEDRVAINSFAEEYDAKVTVKSFRGDHLVFTDNNDSTLVVVHGTSRDNLLYLPVVKNVDIVVVTHGPTRMFLGWTYLTKVSDLVDRLAIDIDALYPMPSEFAFAQPCAHLQKFGGWMDETSKNWVCFGCGIKVIFTENVRS